ncbi:Foxred2 [Symbiodinium natans]|uniref:Foxred2 protein n=1 Tax=Symbiodinium natans TaxID=878477 RepID=A0A812LG38_9DINO|nr:Foxred2 [Symbiodinium natans]
MPIAPRCLAWLAALAAVTAAAGDRSSKYCVVGAGPAGIQIGHFLKNASLDYVTFERQLQAAAWFRKFPIHRKLISINRRNTRSTNVEFNLRHDWNSLLDVPIVPFTNWTEDYFPSADVLADYLQAAADLQGESILYNHSVRRIRRSGAEGRSGGFEVAVQAPSGILSWRCTVVIGAVGLWQAHVPKNWIRGMEHTVGYEELAPWPGARAFDGLSVLILGNGNGAFETSDAVRNFAADIGILGRREERFAHETNYVGDVRAARLTSVDSLQLKSLDDVFALAPNSGALIEFLPCAGAGPGTGQAGNGWPEKAFDTELRGFQGRPPVCALPDHGPKEFLLADHDTENPAVQDAMSKWAEHVHLRNYSKAFKFQFKKALKELGKQAKYAVPGIEDVLAGRTQVLTIKKSVARKLAKESAEFRAALPALMASTQGLYVEHDRLRKPFDVVIRALGWRMEPEPFEELNMQLDSDGKYPEVDACFESTEPGLYFAGTVTHGFDKKRFGSAGGFIHGFRYTAKTLFRCLMHRFEERAFWHDSHQSFDWRSPGGTDGSCEVGAEPETKNIQRLRRILETTPHWNRLLTRLNEASGPYQMSCGALVDGLVYDRQQLRVAYYQDIPIDLLDAEFQQFPRVYFQFRYGKSTYLQRSDLLRTRLVAHKSSFLHPVLFYVMPNKSAGNAKHSSRLHLVEDRWTDWTGREEVLSIHYFLTEVEKSIWQDVKPPKFHEGIDNLNLTCNHFDTEADEEQ